MFRYSHHRWTSTLHPAASPISCSWRKWTGDRKLAVVANRTRKNTKSFRKLMRFLDSLGIPIIAVLRDTQNFVHAAEKGVGICEMPPSRVRTDVDEINKIVRWLDAWPQRRRDNTSVTAINKKPKLGGGALRRAIAQSPDR